MICSVIKWSNGLVMVFDENGKQIPYYQGDYVNVREKILKAVGHGTKFQTGDWKLNKLTFINRKEF